MASSRKKQDEKNLKTLRELGSLPQNKYCFDCGQRGPTYVNTTIGSFVCTKCSGILRGLTPPHRVKSISMATFTPEEIDLLRQRGNEYCRRVWLGLYKGSESGGGAPPNAGDEHSVRDFMIEKYERKRYYLGPSKSTIAESKASSTPSPTSQLEDTSRPLQKNNNLQQQSQVKRPVQNANMQCNNNSINLQWPRTESAKKTNNNNMAYGVFSSSESTGGRDRGNGRLNGFVADFDNNPAFKDIVSMSGNMLEANSNSTPPTNCFPKMSDVWMAAPPLIQNGTAPPPVEDKYAALKDLDNEVKSKGGVLEWGVNQSQQDKALFGTSPLQGDRQTFATMYPEAGNPFGGASPWTTNPFKLNGVAAVATQNLFHPATVNGVITPAPNTVEGVVGGTYWPSQTQTANPFKARCSGVSSNNPFL